MGVAIACDSGNTALGQPGKSLKVRPCGLHGFRKIRIFAVVQGPSRAGPVSPAERYSPPKMAKCLVDSGARGFFSARKKRERHLQNSLPATLSACFVAESPLEKPHV